MKYSNETLTNSKWEHYQYLRDKSNYTDARMFKTLTQTEIDFLTEEFNRTNKIKRIPYKTTKECMEEISKGIPSKIVFENPIDNYYKKLYAIMNSSKTKWQKLGYTRETEILLSQKIVYELIGEFNALLKRDKWLLDTITRIIIFEREIKPKVNYPARWEKKEVVDEWKNKYPQYAEYVTTDVLLFDYLKTLSIYKYFCLLFLASSKSWERTIIYNFVCYNFNKKTQTIKLAPDYFKECFYGADGN